MYIVVEQTGRIVERITIQMAHAHNDLDWVSEGMPGCGQVCHEETERSPQELPDQLSVMKLGMSRYAFAWREVFTYHSHGLHAKHHRVRGHIPRVGQRILLPQLPEQILGRRHMSMVDDKVPLEEAVECARWILVSSVLSISGGTVVIQSTNHRIAIRSASRKDGCT